jgi:hypothetical protein
MTAKPKSAVAEAIASLQAAEAAYDTVADDRPNAETPRQNGLGGIRRR